MVQEQSKLGLHEALWSLWEAHGRWRLSKSWYCSLLLPESGGSNFNLNIRVQPGPLPTMPAGRAPAGKAAQPQTPAKELAMMQTRAPAAPRAGAGAVLLLSGGHSCSDGEGFSRPEVLNNTLCLRAGSRGEGGCTTLLLNRLLLAPYAICTPTEAHQPPRGAEGIFSAGKAYYFLAGKFSCS